MFKDSNCSKTQKKIKKIRFSFNIIICKFLWDGPRQVHGPRCLSSLVLEVPEYLHSKVICNFIYSFMIMLSSSLNSSLETLAVLTFSCDANQSFSSKLNVWSLLAPRNYENHVKQSSISSHSPAQNFDWNSKFPPNFVFEQFIFFSKKRQRVSLSDNFLYVNQWKQVKIRL